MIVECLRLCGSRQRGLIGQLAYNLNIDPVVGIQQMHVTQRTIERLHLLVCLSRKLVEAGIVIEYPYVAAKMVQSVYSLSEPRVHT